MAFQHTVSISTLYWTWRTFIIDGDRATAINHGTVIHHCAQFRGDKLPYLTAKYGGAAAVKVPFQTMPHGFMQQHTRPASAQYHWECPCRCRHGRKIDHRHTHGFFCPRVRTGFTVDVTRTSVITKTTTAAVEPRSRLPSSSTCTLMERRTPATDIRRQGAVRRRDQTSS